MLCKLMSVLSSASVLPQDIGGVKVLKKASVIWKLFMLVMVGICGVYLCFLGVDWKKYQSLLAADAAPDGCRKSDRHADGFLQHYPEPSTYSREECACTPVHYFAIMSMQRSGSGWFETLLNNHPNISSHGEVFSLKNRRENFSTIVETLDTIYNLDWVSSASKNECTSAVGFKWMLNQGAMEYRREVAAYLQRRGVSIILLLRRNTLRRLISILANAYDRQVKQFNGTHKSHVHSEEEAKMLAEFKPVINVDHLPGNLQRVQQITNHAVSIFNSSRLLVVFYEDVVKDKKVACLGVHNTSKFLPVSCLPAHLVRFVNHQNLLKIEKFLGVPAKKLESKQVKIHRRPLSQQIQNWPEVAKRLAGTEFESFLADDEYS